MRCSRLIVACSACLFSTGCVVPFPHSRVHDLGVTGRLVDADTGDAVRGARIESTSDEQTGNHVSVDAGDVDGRFSVKPTRRTHGGRMYLTVNISIWPSFNLPAPRRTLRISAPGYGAQEIVVSAPYGTPRTPARTVIDATFAAGDDTLRDCVIPLRREERGN